MMDFFEKYEKEIKHLNDHSEQTETRIKELASMTTWAAKWNLAIRQFDDMERNLRRDKFYPYLHEKEFNDYPDKEKTKDISDRFGAACNRFLDAYNAWAKVSPILHESCDRDLCDAINCRHD